MTLNPVPLLLLPGIGITGYLVADWYGALAAAGVWLGAAFAVTLIVGLRHPRCAPHAMHPASPRDRKMWLARFGVRLRQLQPSMSSSAAATLALRTWPEAADLAPEEAAEIYVTE